MALSARSQMSGSDFTDFDGVFTPSRSSNTSLNEEINHGTNEPEYEEPNRTKHAEDSLRNAQLVKAYLDNNFTTITGRQDHIWQFAFEREDGSSMYPRDILAHLYDHPGDVPVNEIEDRNRELWQEEEAALESLEYKGEDITVEAAQSSLFGSWNWPSPSQRTTHSVDPANHGPKDETELLIAYPPAGTTWKAIEAIAHANKIAVDEERAAEVDEDASLEQISDDQLELTTEGPLRTRRLSWTDTGEVWYEKWTVRVLGSRSSRRRRYI